MRTSWLPLTSVSVNAAPNLRSNADDDVYPKASVTDVAYVLATGSYVTVYV